MKSTFTLIILLATSFTFGQEQSFHLKVGSVLIEGDTIYQIPTKEMTIDIKDGKMKLSGYNIFMEEKESTEYTLAQELGNGNDEGDYTFYRVNMYYNNNPVPDNDLEIYQYINGTYKLIISSAAMITELFCTEK
jgi:hypothetical protein